MPESFDLPDELQHLIEKRNEQERRQAQAAADGSNESPEPDHDNSGAVPENETPAERRQRIRRQADR